MFFIECNHLAKNFGKTIVFRQLDFTFKGDLCIGIEGANGSGKSTLLKCLCGLLRPTSGKIRWMEHNNEISLQSIRNFIGFAAPYIQLYHDLTVAENLAFLHRVRPSGSSITFSTNQPESPHQSKPPPQKYIADLMELTSLTALAHRDYGTLSSGQQQRARIAAALVSDPPILMLDEPGTNLDAEGFSLVSGLVTRHKKRGGIVFIASNRQEELQLCDEHVVL